ncbi:MAG: hypothetical protein QJR07_06515 [Acetobacteraceae bacterium]|nr:hypothetical protein [Acetobacteraceae bacterium]
MDMDEMARRDVLGAMAAALPLTALLARVVEASVQPGAVGTAPAGTSPVRVDTKGLAARIKFEEVISGPLGDLNGRFTLRVTELTLEPGGYVANITTPALGYDR